MVIRQTQAGERPEILKVHREAFGPEGEEIAGLVDDLLDDVSALPLLSLAAFEDGRLTGHILFTRARISGHEDALSVQLLAPLAILPQVQGTGLGQALIHAGLEQLRENGTDLVFVLGHPGYYPRCGFVPAGELGLDAPYPIAPENAGAWMVQALKPDIIGRVKGQLQCAEALDEPHHWTE